MLSYEDFIKRVEILEKKQIELELTIDTLREQVLKTKLKLIQPLNDSLVDKITVLITTKVGVFPFKDTNANEYVFARAILYHIMNNYYNLRVAQIQTLIKSTFKNYRPKTKDIRSTITVNIQSIDDMLKIDVEKHRIKIYNDILNELNLKK